VDIRGASQGIEKQGRLAGRGSLIYVSAVGVRAALPDATGFLARLQHSSATLGVILAAQYLDVIGAGDIFRRGSFLVHV